MRDKLFMQTIGQLGGLATAKRNEGTKNYSEMGKKGGGSILKTKGRDYFVRLGQLSQAKQRKEPTV